MRNLQLPEAAFTQQSPGTCPRARQRQMGYPAENDCTKGTIPSCAWAPSFSPVYYLHTKPSSKAGALQKRLSGRQPASKRPENCTFTKEING